MLGVFPIFCIFTLISHNLEITHPYIAWVPLALPKQSRHGLHMTSEGVLWFFSTEILADPIRLSPHYRHGSITF